MGASMNEQLTQPDRESISSHANVGIQEQICAHLLDKYGPVLGSEALWQVLSFKSRQAFDRSVQRRLTKLPLFRPEGREGVYVLAPALAAHLVEIAERNQLKKEVELPSP